MLLLVITESQVVLGFLTMQGVCTPNTHIVQGSTVECQSQSNLSSCTVLSDGMILFNSDNDFQRLVPFYIWENWNAEVKGFGPNHATQAHCRPTVGFQRLYLAQSLPHSPDCQEPQIGWIWKCSPKPGVFEWVLLIDEWGKTINYEV